MSNEQEKAREFWINIYDNEHRVYDCVAHTSLEKCRIEGASHVKETCVHVIEHSAYLALKAENEKLKGANEALENRIKIVVGSAKIGHTDSLYEVGKLKEANKKLRDALVNIEEYWNRDANEQAMQGACWHAVETAAAALSEADKIEGGKNV